jgi:hypothetical protein
MARKKPSYKGKLAEPLYADDYFQPSGLLADHDEVARRGEENLSKEFNHRIDLLFDHWDIDRADWKSLAITLAIAHVPGFRREPQRKRTGPAQIWDSTTYTELLATVERLKQEKKCNDSEACRIILKSPEFANERWNKGKGKGKGRATYSSLFSRLSEARNPKYNVMAKMFRPTDDPDLDEVMRESLIRYFAIPLSQDSKSRIS